MPPTELEGQPPGGAAKRGLPFVAVAVVGVGGLIAGAVSLALLLGLGSASRNTQALWAAQADTLIESMEASLVARLAPVAEQAQWVRDRVASGALDLENSDQLDAFMIGALGGLSQVGGVAYVDSSGRSRRWARNATVPVNEDWSGREVIRTWLEQGRARDEMSWQSVFWTATLDATVLLHETPLKRKGVFLGMLGYVVPVAEVSLSFTRDYGRIGLVPFVLYGRERVLVHPKIDRAADKRVENASALPSLTELGDPVLARIWSPDDDDPPGLGDLHHSRGLVRQAGVDYLILHRTVDRFGPQPWTFGAYLDPREQGAREVRRIALAGGAGVAVLLIAVAIATVVGLRLSRRIGDLAAAARQVEAGERGAPPRFRPSGIREIDDASRAFAEMVAGLGERDLIRDTLGRFVPNQIARRLLDAGGHIEPRGSEATVLFCDIEGFTALTESLGPPGVVAMLNGFFSAMVEILERHHGVVTQFQGDALLATFNVPEEDPEHASNALSAALEMLGCSENSTFAGQRLRIRIGIDTGIVVAGAVGAKGRLSYTVHGDAVNLAARLEELNKVHGTRILASEHTATRVNGFNLVEVANAPLRGRSSSIAVFEVRGSEGGV